VAPTVGDGVGLFGDFFGGVLGWICGRCQAARPYGASCCASSASPSTPCARARRVPTTLPSWCALEREGKRGECEDSSGKIANEAWGREGRRRVGVTCFIVTSMEGRERARKAGREQGARVTSACELLFSTSSSVLPYYLPAPRQSQHRKCEPESSPLLLSLFSPRPLLSASSQVSVLSHLHEAAKAAFRGIAVGNTPATPSTEGDKGKEAVATAVAAARADVAALHARWLEGDIEWARERRRAAAAEAGAPTKASPKQSAAPLFATPPARTARAWSDGPRACASDGAPCHMIGTVSLLCPIRQPRSSVMCKRPLTLHFLACSPLSSSSRFQRWLNLSNGARRSPRRLTSCCRRFVAFRDELSGRGGDETNPVELRMFSTLAILSLWAYYWVQGVVRWALLHVRLPHIVAAAPDPATAPVRTSTAAAARDKPGRHTR